MKLSGGVDIEIGHWICHGIEMARLAREIEKKLAFFDKRRHCSGITNIGKIDSHAVADVVNVKKVPAIFRDQTVHQGNLCAELDQTPGQSGADETEPTGDENVGAGKNVRIPRHGRIVGRRPKDFL